MDKLVDAAVELVEGGKLQQAVTVLQQGIEALSAAYPGRWGAGRRGAGRVKPEAAAVNATQCSAMQHSCLTLTHPQPRAG